MARLEAMALQELACAVPLADDTPPAAPLLTCMDWDLGVPGAAGAPPAAPTADHTAGPAGAAEPPPGRPGALSTSPLPRHPTGCIPTGGDPR
ncbi:hypothetical protein CSC68_04340 [Pseudoxanthomonas suwonensis]|nr:hypothetical protein CSC68_04340 [Pseudoxanthomonas suwonensis]